MESDSTKFNKIYTEIQMLCLQFQDNNSPMKLETMISYYNRSNLLLDEANNLINKIESDIETMLTPKLESDGNIDKHMIHNVDYYLSLLSNNGLNINELCDILADIKRLSASSDKLKISECDVFYEETNVDNF